jgi:CHAT domain-containing protein
MADHSWVNLSCRGHQDLNNPSAAGFMLSNDTLTIVRLSPARYTGEFSVLSACRTATRRRELARGGITLATALNYTGY